MAKLKDLMHALTSSGEGVKMIELFLKNAKLETVSVAGRNVLLGEKIEEITLGDFMRLIQVENNNLRIARIRDWIKDSMQNIHPVVTKGGNLALAGIPEDDHLYVESELDVENRRKTLLENLQFLVSDSVAEAKRLEKDNPKATSSDTLKFNN